METDKQLGFPWHPDQRIQHAGWDASGNFHQVLALVWRVVVRRARGLDGVLSRDAL